MLRLVISDNEGTTTVVPLVRDEISIGRKEGNTIRLTERNVSRHHARLQRENGEYRVKDLDSYNGTIVNGVRVESELDVGPGDRIEIGDYAILVEAEAPAEAGEEAASAAAAPAAEPAEKSFEDDPTQVAAQKKTPAVARLVVLAGPGAGSEFSLPASGSAKVGRGEDLAISIDHRSVSREHAELVVDDAGVRIRDLGSSNGMRVDGVQEGDCKLGGGEVIELGEVLLRYVAPGERYIYDPADAAPYLARQSGRRPNLLLAAGIVGVALLVAIVIIGTGDEPAETIASSPVTPQEPEVIQPEAVEVEPDQAENYGSALEACRSALEGGRFAEAMAHAAVALRAREGDADAQGCERAAQSGLEQEQAFVRARAALGEGDLDTAQRELSSIAPDSPLLAKPEVADAMKQLAMGRLDQARAEVDEAPFIAAKLAQDVLDLGGAPEELRAEASQLLARARAAPRIKAKTPKPRATRPARATSAPRKSPMEAARACVAQGDNQCVVKALSGKARTAQELGLLIETYRAMGKTQLALKHMAQYVKRFPTARSASAYQRMLERQ